MPDMASSNSWAGRAGLRSNPLPIDVACLDYDATPYRGLEVVFIVIAVSTTAVTLEYATTGSAIGVPSCSASFVRRERPDSRSVRVSR
jgi:hypothetical protein